MCASRKEGTFIGQKSWKSDSDATGEQTLHKSALLAFDRVTLPPKKAEFTVTGIEDVRDG